MTIAVDLGRKATKQKKSNSLSLLFAFLLMNSLGKQAVSTGSFNQRVEIALLLFVYVFKTDCETVSTP